MPKERGYRGSELSSEAAPIGPPPGVPVTWTLGPNYPIVRCRRCGASLEQADIASGFCWVCGDMGAVEFTREGDDWAK